MSAGGNLLQARLRAGKGLFYNRINPYPANVEKMVNS
jgi:hypothetical protein